MAKVLCIDDFRMYAEMIGTMLAQKGGHEVRVDVVPLSLDEIRAYDPDVIVINLVRKAEVLGFPVQNFYREVDGAKAVQAIAQSPLTGDYPIVLTALALKESELPADLRYEAFIEVPQKIDYLLHTINRLAQARRNGDDVAPH